MNRWLTTKEASVILDVTPDRISQMYRDGTLVGEKVGRDILLDPESVEAAKERKTKPGPAPKKAASDQPETTRSATRGKVKEPAKKRGKQRTSKK